MPPGQTIDTTTKCRGLAIFSGALLAKGLTTGNGCHWVKRSFQWSIDLQGHNLQTWWTGSWKVGG